MVLLIFLWVIGGFAAMAFWEAYIEGKDPWAGRQVGWAWHITPAFTITAYHFWVWVMLALFLSLPLIVSGWDAHLFGVLLSAAAVGMIVEDFLWFVINPKYPFRNFNAENVHWYPWLKIGRMQIPWPYIFGIAVALGSWYFLWK